METKYEIAKDWLPRYTGMPLEKFGHQILLTNFSHYVNLFSDRFDVPIYGQDKPMQACTNDDGITLINFGIGSPNAATIMDLLSAIKPKGALLLGKCGGMKKSTEIGNFILPIAAIRGEGTSQDYLPPEVPALPSFKLHKLVSEKIIEKNYEYRTGVVYTTNRRVWEHDSEFHSKLKSTTSIAVDMETATIFIVGHHNEIARGALLLVSDLPFIGIKGIKTSQSDKQVTQKFCEDHLAIGINTMMDINHKAEKIKHFHY